MAPQRKPLIIMPLGSEVELQGIEARSIIQKPVTAELRREIVRRYELFRLNYDSVAEFAKAESARLLRIGYVYRADTIQVLINRNRRTGGTVFVWERLLKMFRTKNPRTGGFWFDFGDISVLVGLKSYHRINCEIIRLKHRGYEFRRARSSVEDKQVRGWDYMYRLWEA